MPAVQETIDQVKLIDVDQYKNLNISHYRKNVSFEKSVPTSYQKEILKFTCKTVLVVDTSKGFDKRMTDSFNTPTLGDRQTAVSFVLSAYWDRPKNRFAVPLTYTSQNADGQHYVEVETVKSMTASFIGSFVAAHAEPQSLPN